jgi:hypothetical protein
MKIKFTEETFQFPKKDTLLLHIEYTSIEDLAEVITLMIYKDLEKKNLTGNITNFKVTVQEYDGLKCQRILKRSGTVAKL